MGKLEERLTPQQRKQLDDLLKDRFEEAGIEGIFDMATNLILQNLLYFPNSPNAQVLASIRDYQGADEGK